MKYQVIAKNRNDCRVLGEADEMSAAEQIAINAHQSHEKIWAPVIATQVEPETILICEVIKQTVVNVIFRDR